MKNKHLIIVDMQVDFITGALANPNTEWAQKVIQNILKLLKEFDGKIWFTRDTHSFNYLDTQEGQNLKIPHCIKGTTGWNIIPELRDYVTENNVIDKNTFGFPYFDQLFHARFRTNMPWRPPTHRRILHKSPALHPVPLLAVSRMFACGLCFLSACEAPSIHPGISIPIFPFLLKPAR